jgi:transporter family-2 protein
MTSFATLFFLAIIGGVAVTLQGQFMGLMDQGLGTRESVFITYASGGLLACLAMLVAAVGTWLPGAKYPGTHCRQGSWVC